MPWCAQHVHPQGASRNGAKAWSGDLQLCNSALRDTVAGEPDVGMHSLTNELDRAFQPNTTVVIYQSSQCNCQFVLIHTLTLYKLYM